MLTSSIVSVDSSKVYKPKTSQVGLLSTAISKLGDSSFVSKSRESTNMSPVRMRLFRDSSPKQTKGLQGVIVGEYHALTPTNIVFSSIHKSTSPLRSSRNYNESPQRAKVRLDRFKNWDSKLGLELQIQNTKFTRLNNELTYLSHQPHHQTNKSAIFLGSNLSRLGVGGNQSDTTYFKVSYFIITNQQNLQILIRQQIKFLFRINIQTYRSQNQCFFSYHIRLLSAKLNAIAPSQIGTFTASNSHELSSLQQSLSRIMKQSRQY